MELSIEEKAKRYDEAIEIAKEINNEQKAQPFNVMTRVFPELKESEDESIRKWIIGVLSTYEHDRDLRNAAIAYLKKRGEQKPTFEMKTTEESLGIDSNTYNKIVYKCIYGDGNESTWSEEDEKMLSDIEDCIKNLPIFYESININGEDKTTERFVCDAINWLKFLKERYTWKPSDEQMEGLRWVFEFCNTSHQTNVLKDLYNDLKKLREE